MWRSDVYHDVQWCFCSLKGDDRWQPPSLVTVSRHHRSTFKRKSQGAEFGNTLMPMMSPSISFSDIMFFQFKCALLRLKQVAPSGFGIKQRKSKGSKFVYIQHEILTPNEIPKSCITKGWSRKSPRDFPDFHPQNLVTHSILASSGCATGSSGCCSDTSTWME